jgi:hypothetical protein
VIFGHCKTFPLSGVSIMSMSTWLRQIHRHVFGPRPAPQLAEAGEQLVRLYEAWARTTRSMSGAAEQLP